MKMINLTGQKFGKLTVADRNLNVKSKRVHWNCLCECGNYTVVDSQNLRSGHTKSCGHCEKFNVLEDGTVMCVLPNGRFFLFDAVDMPLVIRHKWNVADSGYVETSGYNKGKAERHRLHRYILDVPEGMFIDHINGDRWDNRRKNLRFATPKDNAHNHRLAKNSTSGYKGVYFEKRRNKYCAHITVNRKKMHLGYFSDPKTAAMAYDRAAVLYFGEFASPNFR